MGAWSISKEDASAYFCKKEKLRKTPQNPMSIYEVFVALEKSMSGGWESQGTFYCSSFRSLPGNRKFVWPTLPAGATCNLPQGTICCL